MSGNFGGLSKKAVKKLCTLLDTGEDHRSNWKGLAEHITRVGHGSIQLAHNRLSYPTKELLTVFFARCRKIGRPDREAAETLFEVFCEMPNGRAAQIVRKDLKLELRDSCRHHEAWDDMNSDYSLDPTGNNAYINHFGGFSETPRSMRKICKVQ